MARATGSAVAKYERDKILSALKDTVAAYEANQKSFDEKMAEWREEMPLRAAAYAREYNPENPHYSDRDFAPPVRRDFKVCESWEMRRLTGHIARVAAMPAGIVSIRASDPVWDFVGMAACL